MDTNNAMAIATQPMMWIIVALIVGVIVTQAALFIRLALKVSREKIVDVTREQCIKGLKTGVISAIGPSLSLFIVVVGLVAILGGPIVWLKLSDVGGQTTELAAATIGIKAAGGNFGDTLTLQQMSNVWWTMGINSIGWMVFVVLFATRFEWLRNKIGGGDSKWIEIFSAAATLGIFGVFCSEYIVESFRAVDYGKVAAVLTGGISMLLILWLSKKKKGLAPYSLGIAMILGIAAGIFVG